MSWSHSWRSTASGRRCLIQWTAYSQAASIEDVSVNHRRFHVLVSKQFLHGADVVPILQQVGGKTIPEGLTGDALVDPCLTGCFLNRLLQAALAHMMATDNARARVLGQLGGGEHILPDPFPIGITILSFQSVREVDRAMPSAQVFGMESFHAEQMLLKWCDDFVGEHGHAILHPLAIAHAR